MASNSRGDTIVIKHFNSTFIEVRMLKHNILASKTVAETKLGTAKT